VYAREEWISLQQPFAALGILELPNVLVDPVVGQSQAQYQTAAEFEYSIVSDHLINEKTCALQKGALMTPDPPGDKDRSGQDNYGED
jgi:hypothetical protein